MTEPSAAARLTVAVRVGAGHATLTLAGELDILTGARLADGLDTALAADIKHLEVQMRQVTFVDVAGLRALMQARQVAAGHGVELTLVDPQPHIVWLLQATQTAVPLLGAEASGATPVAPRRRRDRHDRRADE